MTFSKSKVVAMWALLLIALGVAIVGAIVGVNDEALGNTIAIVALIIAILAVLTGFFFLRCPACGKTLVRVMRPWQKDGCTCPNCRTKIKYI